MNYILILSPQRIILGGGVLVLIMVIRQKRTGRDEVQVDPQEFERAKRLLEKEDI